MTSKNRIHDAATVLEDGASAIVASGAGSNVLNLGGGGEQSVGPQLPYQAEVELDVSALDTGDGNETYVAQVELCALEGFGSGVVGTNQRTVTATGKYIMPVTNEVNGVRYQFMRIYFTLGGTTPSITSTAGLTVG